MGPRGVGNGNRQGAIIKQVFLWPLEIGYLPRKSAAAVAAHMLGCLASGRTNARCVCLLQDGAVSILSPPVPPAQSPVPVQQLRLADPAEAIACSTDGAFLAVASRTELHVYAVAEGASTGNASPRAQLCWRAPLNEHVRALAISGSAAASSIVVAVGGAPGLRLLVGGGGHAVGGGERDSEDTAADSGAGGGEGGGAAAALVERGVLHAGRAVCGCAISDDGSLLALAHSACFKCHSLRRARARTSTSARAPVSSGAAAFASEPALRALGGRGAPWRGLPPWPEAGHAWPCRATVHRRRRTTIHTTGTARRHFLPAPRQPPRRWCCHAARAAAAVGAVASGSASFGAS